MTTLQTLRMPRGLWADLEQTVIQQDRQFLTDVARNLGLPVQEVLRKCLGSGASQTVVALGADSIETDTCPWWNCNLHGLWRPCVRLRLTPTTACQVHAHPAPNTSLAAGLVGVPTLHPVKYKGDIYWISADSEIVFREDGVPEGVLRFKFIDHRGQRICVAMLRA